MSNTATLSNPGPMAVSPTGTVMNKKLGFIAMIISATGMGLVGTFSRLSVPINPLTDSRYPIGDFLASGRMLTGALGMLLIIVLVKKMPKLRETKITFSVFAGGFCIGASLALYVSSTLMTTISNAVFLIYTGPLFSAILAWIFLKEKISLRNMFFLFLVFVGMVMTLEMIQYSTGGGFTFGFNLGADPAYPLKTVGDLFGLGSGLFYGLSLFFYRYRGDIDSEIRGFYNFIFGIVGALTIMIFRISALDSTNPFSVMTAKNWMWAVVLFLVCGLLAIGLLVVAGKNLLAVELSTVSYWECVVALLLGLFVWGEVPSVFGWIGGLLIIVGGMAPIVWELALKPKRRAEAALETAAVPNN